MSKKLFSEMSRGELEMAMQLCRDAGLQALHDGLPGEYQVQEQRYYLARSYWLGANFARVGETYGLATNTSLFTVTALQGIMAYGTVIGERETRAFPVGMLIPLDFTYSKR